jgi:ATP phosphoribosyltransferase
LEIFMTRTDIRFALPSKGRMQEETILFLEACGLHVHKPNPRQYEAKMPAFPQLRIIFQRPADIVGGVRDGSLDFGIAGMDLIAEKQGDGQDTIILHDALGFGRCYLGLAVPEAWRSVQTMADLRTKAMSENGLRVATKFTYLTKQFLATHNTPATLVEAEGTLEVAPAIGYADMIADLVSTGTTLRDNRLRPLSDGVILRSQGALIANRDALTTRPELLDIARNLLELFEAHLRGRGHYLIIANVRGTDAKTIAQKLHVQPTIGGLQGPTIADVYNPNANGTKWFSVSIVVRKDNLTQAIRELRDIGGSGVIVSPVTYIFEEEPERYTLLLDQLQK